MNISKIRKRSRTMKIPVPISSSVNVSSPLREESEKNCLWVGEDTLDDLPERTPLVSSRVLSSVASMLRWSGAPVDNWLIPESCEKVIKSHDGCTSKQIEHYLRNTNAKCPTIQKRNNKRWTPGDAYIFTILY